MQNKIPIIENKYFENGSVSIEFTFSKILDLDKESQEKFNINENLEYYQLHDAVHNFLFQEVQSNILLHLDLLNSSNLKNNILLDIDECDCSFASGIIKIKKVPNQEILNKIIYKIEDHLFDNDIFFSVYNGNKVVFTEEDLKKHKHEKIKNNCKLKF